MNEYYETENDKEIILRITGNKIDGDVLIDLDDFLLLSNHSWYIKDKYKTGLHYIAAKINGKTVKMHRLLLGITDSKQLVDHKNRNTFDNRRCNLRLATYSENNHNTTLSSKNTSGSKGVYIKTRTCGRSNLWCFQIRINGKSIIKRFSINKYGYDEAKQLAELAGIELRKQYGINLNC